MLITSLLLVAMAPSPTAMVGTTRIAFTKCLHADMKKSLEDKKDRPADYEAALKTVCQTERDAFHKAVVALDKASGDSDADATEDADMQVDDYHEKFLEKFTDYNETHTMPAD